MTCPFCGIGRHVKFEDFPSRVATNQKSVGERPLLGEGVRRVIPPRFYKVREQAGSTAIGFVHPEVEFKGTPPDCINVMRKTMLLFRRAMQAEAIACR